MILGVVGGVIILCCGGGGLLVVGLGLAADESGSEEVKVSEGCGTDENCDTSEPTTSPSTPDKKAPLGTLENPVPRGKAVENKSARYEILDVKVVDNIEFADPPRGKYVLVSIAVKNVKNETIDVGTNDFTLVVNGTEIDSDDATYALDDSLSWDELSPGLRRTGTVAFDVAPKSAGKGVLQAQASFSVDEPVYLALRK